MNRIDLRGESDFTIWSDRSVIADCLRDLGLNELANKAIDFETSQEQIDKFLNIIKSEANNRKDTDVLDRLYFTGLIYG